MGKLAIVQLSDIHATGSESRDHILGKLQALAARIADDTWDVERLLLLLVS